MPRATNNLRDFARRVVVRHRPRRGLLSPIVRASICTAIACGQSTRFVAECFDVTEETVQRCLNLWQLQQSFALRNPKSVAAHPEDDESGAHPTDLDHEDSDPEAEGNTTATSRLSDVSAHQSNVAAGSPMLAAPPVAAPVLLASVPDENSNPAVLTNTKDAPSSETARAQGSLAPPHVTATATAVHTPAPAVTSLANGSHEVIRMPWDAPRRCKACSKSFQIIAFGRQINPARKSYFGCPDCDVALCRWGGCAAVWHQHNKPPPDTSILFEGTGLR